MPLPYHPKPGTIVICDYSTGFRPPEMIKRRLAVTISPKLKRRNDLVTVVPLSTTAPVPTESWHVEMPEDIPEPWGPGPRWAKCDMVATVGYARLNLPHSKHPVTGARRYHQIEIDPAQVDRLRRAVAAAIGLVIEA
ncbi:type II toxin-antitoxin system PemK/MazF family toxin [Sphingomonas sp. S6]|jgi:mRNA interferase MazF|uniref:type II toxin-antitoxin system PemK/MazF family toxin n=1 Tax=Sphingomonas sp. S6 TaxID=3368600 RepID=UPI0028E82FB4|nr:type II toxin-antitoxin system PemK/MazF family toxin [uncultured Sphingomonas sp.]